MPCLFCGHGKRSLAYSVYEVAATDAATDTGQAGEAETMNPTTETVQPILYTADKLIAALDAAIEAKDAKGAATAAIKAAKFASKVGGETAHEIRTGLRTRLAVLYGAPMVPGGRWAYYRGKAAVYVSAFGAPCRFDLRISHVLRVDEADLDRRSYINAREMVPSPGGLYAFLSEDA